VLLGIGLQPIALSGHGQNAAAQGIEEQDPLPPLSEEERVQADVGEEPKGETDPSIADLKAMLDLEDPTKNLVEDQSMRDQESSTYQVEGADHLIQVSQAPLNYLDKDGKWQVISPTLVDDGLGGLQNEAGPFTVDFPATLAVDAPITVARGEGTYSFVPKDLQKTSVVKDDATSVSYKDILQDVDLSYSVIPGGFQERIILSTSSAPSSITFSLSASGLSLRQEKEGDISILSGEDVLSIMPAPWAYDSSAPPGSGQELIGTASYTLTEVGPDSYELTVTVDPEFLKGAKFPVTIDPGEFTKLSPSRDTSVKRDHQSTELRRLPVPVCGQSRRVRSELRLPEVQLYVWSKARRADRVLRGRQRDDRVQSQFHHSGLRPSPFGRARRPSTRPTTAQMPVVTAPIGACST
jgi:hypothetical protein